MWFLMVDEILIFEDDKTNLNHLVGAVDQTKELFFKLELKKKIDMSAQLKFMKNAYK